MRPGEQCDTRHQKGSRGAGTLPVRTSLKSEKQTERHVINKKNSGSPQRSSTDSPGLLSGATPEVSPHQRRYRIEQNEGAAHETVHPIFRPI
jgi:hypothetical protein